ATTRTGDLPHGIWGSGDGGRVYVGLENGDSVQAIDTETNQCVATIPVGQLPQALVYVRNAVTSDQGAANLHPLGLAAQGPHLELMTPPGATSGAHASVAINSLGPIDHPADRRNRPRAWQEVLGNAGRQRGTAGTCHI